MGKEGGTLVPLDIHDVRDTLDKRHPGNLHVNLSVEAYSTGHPGVLYSCLDDWVSDILHFVVLHLHLGGEAPDRRGPSLWEEEPVVAGRTLMWGAPEGRLPAPLGQSLVLLSLDLHLL